MNAKYYYNEGAGLERLAMTFCLDQRSLIKDKDKTCLQTRSFFKNLVLETHAHKIKATSHSELLSGCGLMILFCDQKEKSLLDKMCIL